MGDCRRRTAIAPPTNAAAKATASVSRNPRLLTAMTGGAMEKRFKDAPSPHDDLLVRSLTAPGFVSLRVTPLDTLPRLLPDLLLPCALVRGVELRLLLVFA